MRITIELEQADLERFLAAFEKRLLREVDECDVLDAAKHALNTLPIGSAPAYVRKQITSVQRFILMLEDEDWALPRPQRDHVVETLVYFSDPEDLIPDDIEVLGLLDDAIVLELLLRGQRHVMQAYTDFCHYRQRLDMTCAAPSERVMLAQKLARRRAALLKRIQRHDQSIRAKITAQV
ncbi:MAG: YkvA family protein, partial [Rudaea sp.]